MPQGGGGGGGALSIQKVDLLMLVETLLVKEERRPDCHSFFSCPSGTTFTTTTRHKFSSLLVVELKMYDSHLHDEDHVPLLDDKEEGSMYKTLHEEQESVTVPGDGRSSSSTT
jgi:hypothetical protein